ncbi:MAG: PKD domain-containing protein [Bacteroidota bacterium]
MKRLYLLSTLVLTVLAGSSAYAQDFSNKGKDFWVGYGYHQIMSFGGNVQEMVLYFATEAVTTVTVSIPGTGYSQTYTNIPANTVFTSNPIPKIGAQDARLTSESLAPENKGIHITSDKPIVAYAHIYASSVSGASILFPTSTLGKEYYSVNYKNISNTNNANCWFYVVACDTGTTTVEITPSAPTINHPAGVPFTVNLTQGQIFNVMGALISNIIAPFTTQDLTGSKIQSISSGSGGCKRIAVFSGSGRISITCNGTSSSSDNYMVQAFPKTAWGKKYLTAPTGGVMPNNIFRICVLDPSTIVTVNGAPIGLPLQNNFYYELPVTAAPQLIEGDKPILVAQYITSQGSCGNGAAPGDPEVIYLSPVEQNINKVLWNATPNFLIIQHYFNVIIPNTGTAISSFKLDGVPIPAASFVTHPRAAGYSYLVQSVTAGQHTITSDSGFNAIAYGYGSAESYGYNAGTNVRDLYQYVTIKNQYATVDFPAACRNSPFYFAMTFPYQPAQIKWVFGAALNALGIADVTINAPAADSTWNINGKQLYRYKLTSAYSVSTAGTYPIRILVQNPTPDGCSGEQEISFDLQVFSTPTADFTFVNDGCLTNPVQFTGSSSTAGRSIIQWKWDFNDGATSAINSPSHIFPASGSYNVKFNVITDVGCISDTAAHIIALSDPPLAKFSSANPLCVGKAITFTDQSTSSSGVIITKWYWDFGDGATLIANSNASQNHTYNTSGSYSVKLKVESSSGCQSTVYSLPVTISVNPVADFSLPDVCLPSGLAQFNDLSAISDGTQALFTYQWNFGDGGNAVIKNPTHNYAGTGPFNVGLVVTSNNGCTATVTKQLNTIYAEPQAAFSAPAEICIGAPVNFTDQSTAAGSSVTQWNWDFGDGTTSTLQNPVKNYASAGSYIVKLNVTSAKGCQTVNNFSTHTVVVNQLPTAAFNVSVPNCEMGNITFIDASVANSGSLVKWTWDYGDGSNAVLLNNSPFNHIYSTAGNYSITLKVENAKGCVSSVLSKPLVINSKPLAGFISPKVCLTDPNAPFIDTSTVLSGSIATWSWNFGDANATPANPNTSSLQNPLHRYSSTGSYTATLIVTSGNGCADTVTQAFTINGSIPLSGFAVNGPNTLCSNKTVTITDASTVDFGSIIKVEIYWDFANDPTAKTTDDLPLPGRTYSHTYPEFGSPFTKTYTVKYIAYSGVNCVNSLTKDITLLATPALQFDTIDPICTNEPSLQLTQAKILNGLPGSGIYSGTGISSSGLFNPLIAGPGIYTIRYTYTGTNTCLNFVEQNAEVDPSPIANAGPDKFVLEGGTVKLTPVLVTGLPVAYLWSPVTGLNDVEQPMALASPTDDITYTLLVTSDKGCNSSDDVFVKVLKGPLIPNIFSPNGDGVHDTWEIGYLETYPGCIVDVYNRYGQLIFHSVGYDKPWDGTINGKAVPLGTYYYIVDPKNGRKKMAGYVDIIR